MRTRIWLVAAGIMLLGGPAMALTAVIEVNETPYYAANRNVYYNGATLTNFYAPLPVFFEGWKSTPRDSIVRYLWDFGDGSPRMEGFNAVHVYENPGSYTVTLVLTDTQGLVVNTTRQVTVNPRNGVTYYVDAVSGNDNNNGTSPGLAWRTATKAFGGAEQTVERYRQGDQILFRRGQTFALTATTRFANTKRYGYQFAAFGEGARPIIQNTGTFNGASLFSAEGNGLAHITFSDLDFRCRNEATGDIAGFWYSTGEKSNILFLRCHVSHFNGGFIFSHGKTSNILGGAYIVDCATYSSSFHHIFANVSRLGLLDNHFDLSGNHIAYISWLDKGVIQGNTFSRAARARTALRVSADSDFNTPSNNFFIRNNFLRGWIDPVIGAVPHGDGTRYNDILLHLGPNTNTNQSMEWAVVEHNTLVDGEKHVSMGSYENLIVRNNLMYTASNWEDPRIIFSGYHGFDKKPLLNIRVSDNFIIDGNPSKNSFAARVFEVREYTGPPYLGRTLHENLIMLDNYVVVRDGSILRVDTNKVAQLNQVTSDRQRITTPITSNTYEYNKVKYNLQGWRNLSNQDLLTSIRHPDVLPVTPTCSAPAIVDDGSITVTYSGAQDRSGTGLKEVRLWYKRKHGSWIRSPLVSPGASGSFAFDPILGSGTYYFWAQAEDNQGNRSLPPLEQPAWAGTTPRTTLSQFGDASTFHGQGSPNGELPDGNGNGNGTPPPEPGLFAHYKLDDPPVNGVDDSSGNKLDGAVTPPAVPLLVNGYLDGAYDFAQGDAVQLPSLDILGEGMTLSAWINPSSFTPPYFDGRIVSKAFNTSEEGHYWMLSTFGIPQGVGLRFRLKLASDIARTETLVATGAVVELDRWQHAAATYTNGVMRVYLNGQMVCQRAVANDTIALNPFVSTWIGNQPGIVPANEQKGWVGMLDDVRIYNYALTGPQIAALYNVNIEEVPEGNQNEWPEKDQGVPLSPWPAAVVLLVVGGAAVRRRRSND